jgi:microtubule-associated protein-like 6
VVAGDDFATICVYRFPVLQNDQQCRRYTGHSEHVVRSRFYEKSPNESYIISAGGNDRTYIQWKKVPA